MIYYYPNVPPPYTSSCMAATLKYEENSVNGQASKIDSEGTDDSKRKEVNPILDSHNTSTPVFSKNLNLPLKNSIIFQNEHVAYYNPTSW